VVVLSNVLRKNSSEVHQEFAFGIHRIMESLHRKGGVAAEAGATTAPE